MAAKFDPPFKWLHSSSGRSKRTEIVDGGCFMLEHDATGRFYIGQSDNVSMEVDKQLAKLAMGKHPCKLLNGLYEKDNVIRVFEYRVKSKRNRGVLLNEIKAASTTHYLHIK